MLDHVDHVVLTGGWQEADVVAAVRYGAGSGDAFADGFVDLHGRTDLSALAALLASARVVVSNDTGVAHLAAAVRAPTVAIFGRADRSRLEPPGATCVGGRLALGAGEPALAGSFDTSVAAQDRLSIYGTECASAGPDGSGPSFEGGRALAR